MELLIPIVSVEGCIGRGSDGAIFWSETVIDILAPEADVLVGCRQIINIGS